MQSKYRPTFSENESMRHAFATHQAALGTDLALLSEFLGHSDARTTRRYAKLGAEAFLSVVSGERWSNGVRGPGGGRGNT